MVSNLVRWDPPKPDYLKIAYDVLNEHSLVANGEYHSDGWACRKCNGFYQPGFETIEEFRKHQAREVLKAIGL